MLTKRTQTNPEERSLLPKIAFAGFAKKYREPTLSEGFQDIVKVNFEVRTLQIGNQPLRL